MSALIDGGDRVLFESDVDVSAATGWAEPMSDTSKALVLRLVREGDREDVLNNVAAALRENKSALHDVLYRPRFAELKRYQPRQLRIGLRPLSFESIRKIPSARTGIWEIRRIGNRR